MKNLGWKIYFFLILVLTILTYLWQGFDRIWEVLDLILFVVAMVGLFGFAWKKKFLSSLFWKIYFVIQLIWNIYYYYFLPMSEKTSSVLIGVPQFLSATFSLIFFIPLFIALYLYGFSEKQK